MECLRCGRKMKHGETECKCGHFYDDNLHGKKTFKNKKRIPPLVAMIVVLSGITIFVLICYWGVKYTHLEARYSSICKTKCEGNSYKIKNNKCVCENGEEYPIE